MFMASESLLLREFDLQQEVNKPFSDIPANLNVLLCLTHALKQIPGTENRTVMIGLSQVGFASGAGERVRPL